MKNVRNIESIYNLYVDDLFTYALYLGFEKEVVKDAIHDVFCKFSTMDDKLISLDLDSIKYYLFKSLKNRLLDIYKSQRKTIELANIDTPIPFNINVTVEDSLIDEEEQSLIKVQIEEMLSSLTDRQREIVYLRYIQEYDYKQIADLLNISVHGCRKLISKAMSNLRNKYGSLVLLLLLS